MFLTLNTRDLLACSKRMVRTLHLNSIRENTLQSGNRRSAPARESIHSLLCRLIERAIGLIFLTLG